MSREALGSGWRFPVQITNLTGGIAVSSYEDKIRESIHIILGTAKGERVMRPEFGCGIHDFMFAVIDTSTLTMVKSCVKDALTRWEPRIEVKSVETITDRISQGILQIEVRYQVRSTNTEANLVYPFYLSPGG